MNLPAIWKATVNLKTEYDTVWDIKALAAADNYAAEDVLSEHATLGRPFIFGHMSKKEHGAGTILGGRVWISTTALTPRVTLYLYNGMPTCILNDNVANTGPLEVDMYKWVGQLDFLACEDLGGGSSSFITRGTYGNCPLDYVCVDGKLYGVAVLRDAVTDEAAGMRMAIGLDIERK
jgi:hypothetical protein